MSQRQSNRDTGDTKDYVRTRKKAFGVRQKAKGIIPLIPFIPVK